MIGNVRSANNSATAHAFNRAAAEAEEEQRIAIHKALSATPDMTQDEWESALSK